MKNLNIRVNHGIRGFVAEKNKLLPIKKFSIF
jgi:hypothetical protein